MKQYSVPRVVAQALVCGGLAACSAVAAQPVAPATVGELASLRGATDMVWLIVAGALVFFMQAGFALLESGMSRAKNAINVIMKNYFDMCFGAVAFLVLGYGLMFGANASGWIGTSHFFGIGLDDAGFGMLFFQMMFAATAATIVSGAIAERTRFSAYVVGSVLITGITYPVFGAWAWGSLHGGDGWLKSLGFIDFAGSTVVHSIGGWSALAAILVVGPRLGRFGADGRARAIPGHNLTSVALGAFILWLGWFGFNGGSTITAQVSIGKIVLNTHLAGAAGSIGAIAIMAAMRQPILMTAAVNGGIAGLVGITAGCAVMEPMWAMVTGCVAGALSVIANWVLEARRLDDVVGAVGVHAVGGVWGTLAVALFKADSMWNMQLLGVQALGCAVAAVWGFGSAWVVYKLMALTIGVRASTLDEQRGLDYTEHYEVGYPEFQGGAVHARKD